MLDAGRLRLLAGERGQELLFCDPIGAAKVPQGAGFVAMESAGTAIQGFFNLYDILQIRERAETEGGDRGTVNGRDGRVDGGCKMHGSRIIDIVHDGVFHQCGRLKKRETAAETR